MLAATILILGIIARPAESCKPAKVLSASGLDEACDKNQKDKTVCFEKNMNRTQGIILNGVGSWAGVYIRNHWGDSDIEYYADGLVDEEVDVERWNLIYQLPGKQGLVIGHGENLGSAKAVYRKRNDETEWKIVEDQSLAGASEGRTAPEVQLTEIPDELDLSLLENYTLLEKETRIREVGIICLSPKKNETTFIAFNTTEEGWYCDKTWHCQFGGDEARCNTLAKAAFYPPIYSAAATMAIGCTFLVVLMLVDYSEEGQEEKGKRASEMPEVDTMIRSVKESREVEGNYDLLHGAQGGVRMLIGASFTVLSTPQERNAMAKYILGKEVEIHKSSGEALRCLRSKGWSQKETFKCLDHVESPGCLKKAKHQVESLLGPLNQHNP